MYNDDDELTDKIKLDNCSEELGEKFIKYLDDNFICYKFSATPCFRYNNIMYDSKTLMVTSFAEFVTELKENCIDEIFLYLLKVEYANDGIILYTIRYAPNKDILDNNISALSSLFKKLEKVLDKKYVFSPSKVKEFLIQETEFSEFEIAKIMEFIRLFCITKNKGE